MKCQNIRSVIDMSSRREPFNGSVRTHLQGCSACRQYADQTDHLIALLRSQPRVGTPTDFDFKLRARIARAGIESGNSFSLPEIFRWGNWGRTAAAATALALAVTFSAIHLTWSSETKEESTQKSFELTGTTSAIIKPENNTEPAAVDKVNLPTPAVKGAIIRSIVKSNRESMREKLNEVEISPNPGYETFPVYNRQTGQIFQASTRQTFIGAENSAPGVAKRPVFVPSI
ncbi:MAG: hypothetical protein L0220_29675 [Acidobacteria bacterium]|nr:hypothetical protein [Acidobacteriota bacterium]